MTPEQLEAIRNRAALARSIAHGPNALLRALASADDVPTLLAEIERLTKHSKALNAIGFAAALALGDVPPGADQIQGNPIEQVQRLIDLSNPKWLGRDKLARAHAHLAHAIAMAAAEQAVT